MKIKPLLVVLLTLGLFYFYYSIFSFAGLSSFTPPAIHILIEKPTTSTNNITPDSSKQETVVITNHHSTKRYHNKETSPFLFQLNTRYGSFIWVF